MGLGLGLLLVTLAGLGTGTCAWPMKVISDFRFELYVFFNTLLGLVIYPWMIVLLSVPHPLHIVSALGLKTLLLPNLLSMSWGVANLLYVVCVIRIGAALTGAILSALGMSVGVLLPMVLKGSGLFSRAPSLVSKAGAVILAGLFVMIAGAILTSIAGFGREKALGKQDDQVRKKQASGDFLRGLLLVVIAGILSCGLSLEFVYSQGPVIAAVKAQGGTELAGNFAVWAFAGIGGALVNLFYPCYLMSKKRTWNLLFHKKSEMLCGALIGVQFIASIVLLGRGMVLLGVLGASIGFGIQQSLQIIGNQLVGFVGGEWRNVTGPPRKTMYWAIAVILTAVVILAVSHTLRV